MGNGFLNYNFIKISCHGNYYFMHSFSVKRNHKIIITMKNPTEAAFKKLV